MNIDAITQVLGALSPASPTEAAMPDLPTQQRFAQLLKTPELANDPSAMLALQGEVNRMLVGSDLVAKVVGGVSQGVNKLVSAA